MRRNLALDGLRGYAALAVVLYHGILAFDGTLVDRVLYTRVQDITSIYDFIIKFFLIICNGETAVMLFFILSGVVLFDSLVDNRNKLGLIKATSTFALKRVFRIYPALIVCLVFYSFTYFVLHSFMPTMFPTFTLDQFVENAILHKITLIGASWTLQVEIIAIPFIILGFYLNLKSGIIGLILYLSYAILIVDNPNLNVVNNPYLAYGLMYFICGFIIATKLGERIVTLFDQRSWIYILLSMLIVRNIVPRSSYTALVLQMVFATILVGILYYRKGGKLDDFLEKKYSVYLGKISFSFYLYNVVFLNIFIKLITFLYPSASKHTLEFGILAFILTTIFTIPISHYSERYIEQPFIRLGKLITNRLMQAAPDKPLVEKTAI